MESDTAPAMYEPPQQLHDIVGVNKSDTLKCCCFVIQTSSPYQAFKSIEAWETHDMYSSLCTLFKRSTCFFRGLH